MLTAEQAKAKAMVRRAIVDAALDLFEQQGFDQVTVQQIADAAGVTRRTVHRHFPAKAAVIHGYDDDLTNQILAVLRDRPATESVLTASRAVVWELLYGKGELVMTAHQLDTLRRVRRLMIANPELQQGNWPQALRRRQEMAAEFAHRSGLPVTDLRVQLAAATWNTAALLAMDLWAADTDTGLTGLAHNFDAVLTGLTDGLDVPAAPAVPVDE
ncbi:TetR family transcriptional regulator [Nocardia sp. NPDC006044]|uniref:TetR family transcriptional regulator n=1 Tax=Nocardia sp. NPDC006044 TaxID=3364306 RepID=UPI0036C007A5